MEIDILIDKLTDCLTDTQTGKIVNTEYKKRETDIIQKEYDEWKFDWSKPTKNGYDIYELFLENDNIVQGRIAVKIDGGVADVDIVETAPHNFGHEGRYEGVGGHLFAIACKLSLDAGCDGYVAFTAKTNLIEHYQETLNAKVLNGQRMFIDENVAKELIEKYLER